MTTTIKQVVIEMIERLPDDASVEDILAELSFCHRIDEGLRQLDAGEGIEHDEARRRLLNKFRASREGHDHSQ